jgi:hypothetical protein
MPKLKFRRTATIAVAIAVAALTAVAGATPAAAKSRSDDDSRIDTVLDGLSSPKGLAVWREHIVVVAQGAFGPPGPVLALWPNGRFRDRPFEVTEPIGLVDVAVAHDGSGWGLGSEDGVLYRRDRGGNVSAVLDIRAYQQTDPDPYDQEDAPEESNPYGLAVLRNGDALVADAANNDILRVTPDGGVTTVARFDTTLTPTDHVGDPGLPPQLPAEAVPTTVTVGPGGDIYVGQLPGFPFRPGSSRVWQIDDDADGALCSVTTPDPDCRVYASGFTAIQDIAFDHSGALYVYELAADGVLAFEAGFETGEFPPAVLIQVKRYGSWRGKWQGRRTELAAGQLSQPGGVAVAHGEVFVTDQVFTGGRLLEIDT